MRSLCFLSVLLVGLATWAGAQTVTVDNTNATPNNTTTFNSVMAALHSFQFSGKVTAATNGSGVGVNNGQAGENIINVVATGIAYNEILRVDERGTSAEQNVQNEPFKIVGIASGLFDKPVIQPKDDGTNDDDGFEVRTDVNFEIHNIVFSFDPAFPHGGGTGISLVTIDRLTASTGTPSTCLFKDCVFTGNDATGTPLVTNADEAFVDRRSSLVNPTGGAPGRTVAFFPDPGEGMIATFEGCVFSQQSTLSGSRHGSLYCFLGGIASTWTEEAGMVVKSCTFTHSPGVAIESQSGGNSLDATKQFINITGTDAKSGGLASGAPTVIYNHGNSTLPGNGVGIFLLSPSAGANNALSGTWDNLWILNMTGSAIFDDVLDVGGCFYWSLADSVIANTNLTNNRRAVRSGWRANTAGTPSSINISDVTFLSGNASSTPGEIGHAIQLLGNAVNDRGMPVNISNVVFAKAIGALNPVGAVSNEGPCAVTITDSAMPTAGLYGLNAATVAANTGAGSLNQTNVLSADPVFVNATDFTKENYLALMSPVYETARAGQAIDGGRFWTPPPASARSWSLYE